MKIILSGSTGFVGTEVIRQSLLNPKVTSLIALTRRPIDVSAIANGAGDGSKVDTSKVKIVVLEDFMVYPEDVKKELADADACIWTLALTPMRSKQYAWEDVLRINKDYCIAGMNAIADSRRSAGKNSPFRFMYMSGRAVEPNMTKKPMLLGDYTLHRSDVETQVYGFAAAHAETGWQACVARPGLISGFPGAFGALKNMAVGVVGMIWHAVSVHDCVAAMLNQCVNGFEKNVLPNEDMARLANE